ncbi:MmgE/PrpD family protein [Thalassobaculum sp. OXR-137]|uniref:MmgE/PrpD family protein n=1 Tax=Thalassobaculum sp. OXR-137 TaxID=3100173 RepID=UPI002AC97C3F|nr:MmgE/PrpD family protein [Thalassobaculum sp. OXR-137]WPZ32653.1 MmgE/PrpD family protein [Thalassobaculum sp. OXR-137]
MDGAPQPTDPAREIVAGIDSLTRWAADLRFEDIPEPIRVRAATVLADDLAAIVAAREEPELIGLTQGMATSSGAAEATVFDGRGTRLDRYSAATVNGSAADWCELDEGYRRVICHAGLYCVPALLAEAEASRATARDLLRALTVGYEISGRVARAFGWATLTLHPHGSLAAVGAAASVAALRGLTAEEMAKAISTACTLVVPGPFNHTVEGALVRNVWPGVGAWSGLRAVDWTLCGITGRPESLHDVYASAFNGEPHPGELTDGLGKEWALSDGYHKLHACCQYAHSAVEASLALHAKADASKIREIHIDTHWKGRHLDNAQPATTLAAKFSMQHILAATAQFGHAGAEAFHASTLTAPELAAMREKVTIGAYDPEPEWPNDRPARVTWVLSDGARVTEECLSARGGPDRPFDPSEVRAKIRGIVDAPYPAMGAALERLLDLDPAALDRSWADTVTEMTA